MPIVNVQLKAIERYAKKLHDHPIYLAAELGNKPPANVRFIGLLPEESGFIESRIAALKYIQESDPTVRAVLMLQDDFWIDRPIVDSEWNEALKMMNESDTVKSIRLMPCPGPNSRPINPKTLGVLPEGWYNAEQYYDSYDMSGVPESDFVEITNNDLYMFTFQASLWNPDACIEFLTEILESAKVEFKALGLPSSDWNRWCICHNVAENMSGQNIFSKTSLGISKKHMSIIRRGDHSNAVNLATIPYRPTAVFQGKLEPWAKEFAIREGFDHLPGWY